MTDMSIKENEVTMTEEMKDNMSEAVEEIMEDDKTENIHVKEAKVTGYTLDAHKNYLIEIGQQELLTADEEHALARRIANGDKSAENELVEKNLRLVVSIAKRYAGFGLDLDDLISEGNMGLMRAAKKFDAYKGFRFSTYATWWVRQAITRAIADSGRTIRLPVHLNEELSKIRTVTKKLTAELGREPNDYEIAKAVGMSVKKLNDILLFDNSLISLSAPVGDDNDGSEFGDFQMDTNAIDPEENAINNAMKAAVERAIDSLDKREREIIILRFGLHGKRARTLEEVGQEYGITRERVRQIEAKALRKLGHPSIARYLRDFAA